MTDLRDRDDVIDRWLRRAASVPSGPGPNAACLDAEVLAAWADGGLSDSALAAVRAHVADCTRCQVLAAVMMKLEPTAGETAAQAQRPGRLKWLGWFVPLAAAAGAAAIWIFIPREAPVPKDSPAPPAQMAQARAEESAAQTPPPAEAPARSATDRAVDAMSSSPKLKAEQSAPRDLKRQANEKDANAARLDARAEQQRERGQAAAEPKKVDTRVTAPAGAATAVPPPPPPPAAVAPPAAPPPPAQTMTQASADRAAGAGRGGGASAARPSSMAEANLLTKEIMSSDSAIRWRVSAGAVDKSTDAGRTWTAVKTGVTGEFTAGASPSPTICWLVGRAGVVLLTTDGETWQRTKFPEVTDLSAVRATDARTATVTTADGREFSTNDGGNTWFRK